MASIPLFTAQDLTTWLKEPVSNDSAVMLERVVWGWLSPVLGLAERPHSASPQVFSWAVELGAIAHENPAGLSAYQLGEERSQYSSARRAEILKEAEETTKSASGSATGQGIPRGSFPAASPWPECS